MYAVFRKPLIVSVPSSFIYRSDVLGSYSSSPSSESASIKYIDEDNTTATDSGAYEHLETSAEIHPEPSDLSKSKYDFKNLLLLDW